MTAEVRPRRSMLYMPGSNARALKKARSLAADSLIMDLEDAVAPDAKDLAHTQVVQAIREGGYGKREVIVRINGFDSPWGEDDLEAVAGCGADAILLPKVESAAMVHDLEMRMAEAGAPETMGIMCMMETPLGILHAEQVAAAGERLSCLVMGTSDLVNELQASHTDARLPVLTSLGLCLLAARAVGVAIVDGVHLDLTDESGFAQVCRRGKELGFDGKTLIHPKTIAKANEVFSPSPGEVDFSHRIIEAHGEAAAECKGVAVVDGRLIENLHVENAKRLVNLAEAIEALDGAPA